MFDYLALSNDKLAVLIQDANDESAKSEIIRRFDGMIYSIAKKFTHSSPALLDDLVQVGRESLLLAVGRKWDRQKGGSVAAYIPRFIRSAIIEHAMRQHTIVDGLNLKAVRLMTTARSRGMSEQDALTYVSNEIAQTTDSVERNVQFYNAPVSAENLDTPDESHIEFDVASNVMRDKIKQAINQCVDGERNNAIVCRYLFEEDSTYRTIAETYGVSAMRIGQIVKRETAKIGRFLNVSEPQDLIPS